MRDRWVLCVQHAIEGHRVERERIGRPLSEDEREAIRRAEEELISEWPRLALALPVPFSTRFLIDVAKLLIGERALLALKDG